MAFIVTVVDFERVNVSWEASPEIFQPRGIEHISHVVLVFLLLTLNM